MPISITTILLAEDSDDICTLMKFMLEHKGCRVVEAENGQLESEVHLLELKLC
jgi:CheY-like chemotaxis protein